MIQTKSMPVHCYSHACNVQDSGRNVGESDCEIVRVQKKTSSVLDLSKRVELVMLKSKCS